MPERSPLLEGGLRVAIAAVMKKHLETIPADTLVTATGGMNMTGFDYSTHVHDRRTPYQVGEDNAWVRKHTPPSVPISY
jgi:hypothetical protein